MESEQYGFVVNTGMGASCPPAGRPSKSGTAIVDYRITQPVVMPSRAVVAVLTLGKPQKDEGVPIYPTTLRPPERPPHANPRPLRIPLVWSQTKASKANSSLGVGWDPLVPTTTDPSAETSQA